MNFAFGADNTAFNNMVIIIIFILCVQHTPSLFKYLLPHDGFN